MDKKEIKSKLVELRDAQTSARRDFEAARQKLLDNYRKQLAEFKAKRAEIYAELKAAKGSEAKKEKREEKKEARADEAIAAEVVHPQPAAEAEEQDDGEVQLAEILKRLVSV